MTYEEYKRDMDAKRHKKAVVERITSKKKNFTVEFVDLEAETAKFMINQEKARKNAVKDLNDSELARRTALYGTMTLTPSAPNPNIAFRRKKAKGIAVDPLKKDHAFSVPA